MKKHRWLRWPLVFWLAVTAIAASFVWWMSPGSYTVDRDTERAAGWL